MRNMAAFALLGMATLGLGGPAFAQRNAPPDLLTAWVNSLDANGWIAEALSADGKTATFRRPPEPKPDGTVLMWQRFERRDDNGDWRSLVAMSEFDCQAKRTRTLQETTYSEPNLLGRARTASLPGEWAFPVPGSMQEGFLRVACAPPAPPAPPPKAKTAAPRVKGKPAHHKPAAKHAKPPPSP